tara:strand:- start:18 stop:344 length:327 start_codon:yes stop_codon:yes gene_type:complete
MTRFKDFMTGEAVPWVSKKDLSRIQAQINKISDQLDTHESKLDVLKNNQSYISQNVDLNAETIEKISNELNQMIDKSLSVKQTIIAVSTWSAFFTAISFATYMIVTYL